MRLRSRSAAAILAAMALCGIALPAAAHPHVFVTATMSVTATKDGHLAALHNSWWMDELFSSSVVVDFDKDADGKLDKSELAAIGKQVGSSIAEWSYYTFVHKGADRVAMTAPPTLEVIYDDKRGQLRFSFDMRPAQPLDLKSGETTFSNFDDTYFVAFDFSGSKGFVTKSLPKSCRTETSVPTPDEAANAWMASIAAIPAGESVPEDGIKFSEALSTKFKIACGQG